MLDGAAMFSSDALLVAGEPVARPKLDADQTGIGALYRLYRTIDGWIQIAAVEQRHWVALCGALRLPELVDDARFADRSARAEHRLQLEAILAPVFASKTAIVWSRALDDAGVPNEIPRETNAGETVFFDADNIRLGLVAEYDHPIMGTMRQFGNLIDFSETPGLIHGPPPMVGQHTRDILGWLGYDDAEMESLKDEGVVYWPDENYPWTV